MVGSVVYLDMPAFNWTAAFCEFCRGSSLEDIAQALAIPIDSLRRKAHGEKWSLLAPGMAVQTVSIAERGLERLKENREKNLRIAQELQEDLIEQIHKLREGKLEIERVFANGSRAEVEAGLRERVELATYARTVAELSYRALGDHEAAKPTQDERGNGAPQNLTIVLPVQVAVPRQERAEDVEAVLVATEVAVPVPMGG